MATINHLPAGHSVTASKSESAPRGSKVLHRVEIEPSDNGGFTVRVHHRMKVKGDNSGIGSYIEPETHVFKTKQEMDAHTDKIFGISDSKGKG